MSGTDASANRHNRRPSETLDRPSLSKLPTSYWNSKRTTKTRLGALRNENGASITRPPETRSTVAEFRSRPARRPDNDVTVVRRRSIIRSRGQENRPVRCRRSLPIYVYNTVASESAAGHHPLIVRGGGKRGAFYRFTSITAYVGRRVRFPGTVCAKKLRGMYTRTRNV